MLLTIRRMTMGHLLPVAPFVDQAPLRVSQTQEDHAGTFSAASYDCSRKSLMPKAVCR